MAEEQPKKRLDLIGAEGTQTVQVKVVDALEYSTGVSVRVIDNMGDSYWVSIEELELDK